MILIKIISIDVWEIENWVWYWSFHEVLMRFLLLHCLLAVHVVAGAMMGMSVLHSLLFLLIIHSVHTGQLLTAASFWAIQSQFLLFPPRRHASYRYIHVGDAVTACTHGGLWLHDQDAHVTGLSYDGTLGMLAGSNLKHSGFGRSRRAGRGGTASWNSGVAACSTRVFPPMYGARLHAASAPGVLY